MKANEALSFGGVPGAHGQDVVKLEDIFITLQASYRIPEVDILADDGERLELMNRRSLPSDIRVRESVEVLSVTDALKEHDKLMVLGAPGSGKTTFMKYLALTFAQNLSRKRLGLDDKLPILITLQDIADELSGKTIADILSENQNAHLQLDLPDEYFRPYDEAKHFLEYIRQTTGVLLERGTELYAFVHLTFQEYFAACDIYRRCRGNVEKVWEEISPYLHDNHWREVILLLIAKLNGEFDEIGEELIRKILEAETPDEDLLQQNLFLAASCLADDVMAEAEIYESILDRTIDRALNSPYTVQREHAIDRKKHGVVSTKEWRMEAILWSPAMKCQRMQRLKTYAQW